MRTKVLLIVVLLFLTGVPLFGQQIQEKLNVGATPISQGDLRVIEVLTTREGIQIPPGTYRVAVTVNSLGEAQFVIAPFKVTSNVPPATGLSKNALNAKKEATKSLTLAATVDKNTLVKGIASNIEGLFTIKPITPSEALLSFASKQFAASTVLGRDPSSKIADVVPSVLSLEQPTECGPDCIEGYVKVTVRNEGNGDAKGKWNITLRNPSQFYIGSVSDLPAGTDRVVVSSAKIQLPCCSPLAVEAEVHPDFYNKDAVETDTSNNTRTFSLKLK